jgi:hypothetical protein
MIPIKIQTMKIFIENITDEASLVSNYEPRFSTTFVLFINLSLWYCVKTLINRVSTE